MKSKSKQFLMKNLSSTLPFPVSDRLSFLPPYSYYLVNWESLCYSKPKRKCHLKGHLGYEGHFRHVLFGLEPPWALRTVAGPGKPLC